MWSIGPSACLLNKLFPGTVALIAMTSGEKVVTVNHGEARLSFDLSYKKGRREKSGSF